MMNAFSALLEAKDPARNRFRSYRLEAGPDLFDTWLVEVTYGRIGCPGRQVRYAARDEAEAQQVVHRCLRHRASATRRLGVGYRLCELVDPGKWMPTLHGTGEPSRAGESGPCV